ncbi:uncharacterized protein [Pleurodeles waltl]
MLWILVLLQMISTVISGWTTTSNMLWILVLLQMISTVISGHPSCEHTVNISQANHLTIRTSDMKQHCDLNSIPVCPEMIECFKDTLKICSMSNSTKKISYSQEGIGKYHIEYGTDNRKEVDLTEKGCKKTNSVEDATPKPISSYKNINNTFEHATLQPISESSSKNSNLCFLFLPIVVVPFVLWIWYKKKERCWESKKKSAKLCSGSSRSTRPDDSVSEETSTEALNIELHTFIVQVEET